MTTACLVIPPPRMRDNGRQPRFRRALCRVGDAELGLPGKPDAITIAVRGIVQLRARPASEHWADCSGQLPVCEVV